jgi:hypothetical protein
MHAARAAGRETTTEPAGQFGMRRCHEGRRLFVTHLDESHLILALANRFHDAVDAIAGQPIDRIDTTAH